MNLSSKTPTQIDSALAEINLRENVLQQQISVQKRRLRPREITFLSDARISAVKKDIQTLRDSLESVRREAVPYHDEFDRRDGWTRFFIVQHLHTSLRCSSFRATTRIGWLPEYSGASEEEMIESAGDMVCTKCVPAAPTIPKRPTLPALAAEWDKAHAQDNSCPGSGKSLNRSLPYRTGYAAGNYGTCETCGKHVAISSLSNLRKHK